MAINTQIKAGVNFIIEVARTIRELGQVPSGELYAILMPYISLETYNALIAKYEELGFIKVENYLITWIEK